MSLGHLIVGNCLESALYSFLGGFYYLPTRKVGPVFYEEVSCPFLGSKMKDYSWSRILTCLALSGKLLNYTEVEKIQISEPYIKISTSVGVFKYSFELCEVFDTTDIGLENEIIKAQQDRYVVYDDFELSNLGGKHAYLEPKCDPGGFAGKINYYISDRVDGANYVTDCLVESTLDKKQLNSVEYSDSMVRFAVERHLSSISIFGNFVEFYKNGKRKYRKPKAIHKKRIVVKKENNIYKDSEKVKFRGLELEEIFDLFSAPRT